MAAAVLITGASGLLGQRVLQQWRSDDLTPFLVDRRDDDLLIPGTATSLVARVRPSVVLHLAWSASGTPLYRSSTDNQRWVEASLELLRACDGLNSWFIGTGTALDTVAPTDEYSASKVRLRSALERRITAGEMSWLRPHYVVDPDRRRPELVAQAMDARDAGRAVVLQTPDSAHDFVHATDVGRAIVLAVQRRLAGEVPVGSGKLRRVRDLAEAFGVPWRPATRRGVPTPHSHDAADIARLREQGWRPEHTEEMFARA